jgi:hypothetical protein
MSENESSRGLDLNYKDLLNFFLLLWIIFVPENSASIFGKLYLLH